jgi:hypothetical protein
VRRYRPGNRYGRRQGPRFGVGQRQPRHFLHHNGSTIKLKARHDVIGKNIVRETVITQSGEPVDKIIFHREPQSDMDHQWRFVRAEDKLA